MVRKEYLEEEAVRDMVMTVTVRREMQVWQAAHTRTVSLAPGTWAPGHFPLGMLQVGEVGSTVSVSLGMAVNS